MAIDLNKIKYFQAVAQLLNISKASKVVNLSQPALSLQIQGLEYELKVKLFERNNRGLILTEEGRKLYERAQLLIDWEKQTIDIMSNLSGPEGVLKIGSYTTASSYLLTPILKPFFTHYPKIQIEYDYSTTDQIITKIKNLDLDCAVISEVPEDNGIHIEHFFHDELVLVAAKERKIPKEIKPIDLKEHDFLSYPLKQDYCYKEIERKLGKYLNKANVPIESISFDTLKQSLIHDLGISFMPKYLIRNEIKRKELKVIQVKGVKLPIVFSIITKKDRKLPPRVVVFRDSLIKSFN
jgi:DNA-binding transcriptional LysR family regulator